MEQQKLAQKQSGLEDVKLTFNELGERLDKSLHRLTLVGNKLFDESQQPSPSGQNVPAEREPRRPGIVGDFQRQTDDYRMLIIRIEDQISKLERQI